MAFWNKSGPTIGEGDENPAEQEIEESSPKNRGANLGGQVEIELAKIKGQIDSLNEIRKSTTERFGIVTEQMGEIRGMLNDLEQAFSKVEVKATKAIDEVETVQPSVFMTELRKTDGKIEALKANIEGNESLMKDIMSQLKGMRGQMDVYKGTEQIIKLHEEIKNELANLKKVESIVERHADRVETIFLDVEKKFSEFDKFDSQVKDINREFKKMQADFDKMRVQTDQKAEKKEFVDLLNKFNDFEKHTGTVIKLLDERSKHTKTDLKLMFKQLTDKLQKKYKVNLEESEAEERNSEEESKPEEKKKLFGLFGGKKQEVKAEGESEEKSVEEEPVKQTAPAELASIDSAPAKAEPVVQTEQESETKPTTAEDMFKSSDE
jgi:chromosome segregation ATPase